MTALSFDARSLAAAQHAWRDAPTGELAMLVGEHRAELIGPSWMRLPVPAYLAATGLRGWYGKTFHAPDAETPDELSGANLVCRRTGMVRSMDLVARIEDSAIDGRPAIVVRYRGTRRRPWRDVSDHFRPVGDGVMLGFSCGLPLSPRGGAPFLVHRTATPV